MRVLRALALVAVVLLALVLALVLALLVLAAKPRHVGGRRTAGDTPQSELAQAPVRVEWREHACLPPGMVADAVAAARRVKGFGPATDDDKRRLDEAARSIAAKWGRDLAGADLEGIRRMEAALEARRAGARALRLGPQLVKAWSDKKSSIVEIAARFGLPPVAALKQILIECGLDESRVREIAAGRLAADEVTPDEVRAVLEADLGSRVNVERTWRDAMEFERAVGRHLDASSAEFWTEDELREGKGPAVVVTPDFLLKRPALIHGRRVHWIDAKNYMMYGSRLVEKSLRAQVAKYTGLFGPGAVVFSGGVACEVPAGVSALFLDGSWLR